MVKSPRSAPTADMSSLLDGVPEANNGHAGHGTRATHSPGPSRLRDPRILGGVAAALFTVAAAVVAVQVLFGEPSPGAASRFRTVIDSESGEVFEDFRVALDGMFPYVNPQTGRPTLYPAEACFWNRDGTAKLDPTWVFVRTYADKSAGETVCPDCGRRVVPHNPPPPTELLQAATARAGN